MTTGAGCLLRTRIGYPSDQRDTLLHQQQIRRQDIQGSPEATIDDWTAHSQRVFEADRFRPEYSNGPSDRTCNFD